MSERNELQENELLVYLQKINKSIEPYSKPIAVVVGVLILGGIAWGLYSSKQSGDRSDATLELMSAVGMNNPVALAKVSTDYPGTPAAAWSQIFEGNQHLVKGLQGLFADRDEAQTDLDNASAAFRTALKGSSDPLVMSRAHYGLARVAESVGDTDEAIDEYKKCISINESEGMVEVAQERIDALSKADTTEFLTWFGEQDFRPADPAQPPSLPPLESLPDVPSELAPLGDDEESKPLKDGGLELPEDTDPSAVTEPAEKAAEMKVPEGGVDAEGTNDADQAASKDEAAEETTESSAEPAEEGVKDAPAATEAKEAVEAVAEEVSEAADGDKAE